MSLRSLLYAYILGGLTFLPLLLLSLLCFSFYSSVPVKLNANTNAAPPPAPDDPPHDVNDLPRTRKAWLTVRRTFQESPVDASYVTLVKSYLDSRSKDPKRSRPKDMWYVVLKGTVMYLYEDDAMSECDAAVELAAHDVVVYPEGLLDGELFTRRNAICLKPRSTDASLPVPDITHPATDAPWFIFVRSCVDMEDWYLALIHASHHPSGTPTLTPLRPVFLPAEMNYLVATLDDQPDVIPMRWFNALFGRIFYSFYRSHLLESYIIARLMKKLSKVKRPAFLTDVAVTHFSVGNKAPSLSKPMLKELTKEGDASLEVALSYKGEIRATVQATAVINLGPHFKSYTVKLVLAVVLRELEGNLLVKVKRPPSNRIWYAFTKPPRMVVNVEPIVSDRQITWSMILNTIEAKIEEIIIDSIVLPNMDDIGFFDSAEYQHRGGLWADAARLDKPMTAPTAATKPSPHDAAQSPEETGLSPARPEEEPTVEPPSLDSIPIISSATTSSEKPSKAARRRSWFSSGPDDQLDLEHAREVEEDVVRGRRGKSIDPDGSLTPSDTRTVQPSDVSENDPDPHGYLSPELPPRPSSAHSRSSRAHSVSSSVGGDESSNYLSDSSVASKSARHSLGTTTSFLNTLKSKAGDKQALSNTAKEAMRKWGVNWGLKKDNGGNTSPDDVPDVGSSDHRTRTQSTHGRQSYAEMRAAVVERRGRDQGERVDGRSSPIPIPQANGRSPSLSGGRVTSHPGGPASPALSRSLGDNVSTDPFKDRDYTEAAEAHPAPSLIHTQPSQARTMTIPGIHASHRGEVMSMGSVAPASAALESKPKGPTIQSMYRLWKSPILTGQQSEEASSSSPGRGDGDHDVAPLCLTAEVISPPLRPVPPPLPPRTISSVAVRHTLEVADDSSTCSPVSPASEALRSIVSRDGAKRESVELSVSADGETTANKPPLPPRRIQV